MKTALKVLCIIAIVAMMGATAVMAGQNETAAAASLKYGSSAAPVVHGKPIILAQNANYVACYKEKSDMSKVLFRWCPNGSPWTPTNETRNFCYESSEACAAAEMPQSWCIKCEGKQ